MTVNKKKLPRAIRPTTANTSGASPGTSETITEATMSVKPWKDASILAKDALETPPDGRRASAIKLVERFSLWSGAAGLIPVPFVDLAAVGGVQIQMLRRISQIYGVPFSENRGKALIAALAGTMIPASTGIGMASIIKIAPGVGTAIGAIATTALSVGATYVIGMVFIQHFALGGTLLDFNPPDYREFIKAQMELRNMRSGVAPLPPDQREP
jgi:uncharacterized protein (DUF697 family)